MSHRNRNGIRERLAYEAGRLAGELGSGDYTHAIRKAAERLGITDQRLWPKTKDVEEALQRQRRLFGGEHQGLELRRVRQEALEAMRHLERFRPRLVGHALRGSADLNTGARLLLFADSSEEVVLELINRRIPWRQRDRLFSYRNGERKAHPAVSFAANDVPLELVVLPGDAVRNPPIDPVTDRPERGVDAAGLSALLALPEEEARQRFEMGT
jgi:hypothetical protein